MIDIPKWVKRVEGLGFDKSNTSAAIVAIYDKPKGDREGLVNLNAEVAKLNVLAILRE